MPPPPVGSATPPRPDPDGRGPVGRLIWVAAGVLAVLLVAGAGWAGWQHLRDPVAALDLRVGDVGIVRDSAYRDTTRAGEPRRFRDLALATAEAGTVRVTASRPASAATDELPLVVVLGGLRTGRRALAEIPRHDDNLLVAFEYPLAGEGRYRDPGPGDVPAIRRAILRVPAQVRALAEHFRRRAAVDAERTSLLGFSLGALFVPAVQRVADLHGVPFGAVVIGYGGADLARLARANLDVGPAPVRAAAGWLVATAIRPVEPALHLPRLPGDFLILNGSADDRIPTASVRALVRATPDPKEVIRLAGEHMGPGREDVNERVVRSARAWLAGRGHIEATGPDAR